MKICWKWFRPLKIWCGRSSWLWSGELLPWVGAGREGGHRPHPQPQAEPRETESSPGILYVHCTIIHTNLTFFFKWRTQNSNLRHIYKIHFLIVGSFLHILLQSFNKVLIWPKRKKTQNFTLISNMLKKHFKNGQKML